MTKITLECDFARQIVSITDLNDEPLDVGVVMEMFTNLLLGAGYCQSSIDKALSEYDGSFD